MALLIQRVVMNKIDDEKLSSIEGGMSFSSSLLNAVTGLFKLLIDAGRSLGSSVRRISEDKMCPLE